jgi:hypothetical protein
VSMHFVNLVSIQFASDVGYSKVSVDKMRKTTRSSKIALLFAEGRSISNNVVSLYRTVETVKT